MKFVFLGYDFMLPVAESLILSGHELIGIISFPCDQIFNFNHNCQRLAQHHGAIYLESKITKPHVDSLIAQGVEIFISAGYPHKIPPIGGAYGINIHPSMLPMARGAMPVPHIIINEEDAAAGYTIHKLAPEFDTGDIIAQQKIVLADDECVERYCAKVLAYAPAHMTKIIENLEEYWEKAQPQDSRKASAYPLPDNSARTLNWSQDVNHIIRSSRAFGRYGCYAHFSGKIWNVYACDGWVENHEYESGTCLSLQNNMAIIAVNNGFISLKEFSEVGL